MKLFIGGSSSKLFHLQEFADAISKKGIDYKLVPDVQMHYQTPYAGVRHFKTLLNYLNLIPSPEKFKNIVQEFKPDAILIDAVSYLGFLALRYGIPLQIHLRGDYWTEMKWARETLYSTPRGHLAIWWKQTIAEKCFCSSSLILPICDYLGERVRSRYPHKKVEVMYQGIRPDLWFEDGTIELKHPCVGMLQDANIWGKTIEMLTLTKVMKSMPNIHFYWAGGGAYQDYVLPELKKHENFTWLGKLSYPDGVRKFLSSIDVYALISGMDMAPLTLLESQLMQRPVVATRVGGIPEMISVGRSGFLVEKGQPEQIIDKITFILDNTKKARQLGAFGRSFVELNFSWDKIGERYVELIRALS